MFVYYGVKSDDGDEAYAEAAVAVVEEAALGLCAPEPEGTLPLAAAAASTSTKGIPAELLSAGKHHSDPRTLRAAHRRG